MKDYPFIDRGSCRIAARDRDLGGAQLAEALADEQARPTVRPEFDWRQPLLAMHELLRQDYELIRHPAIYYLKRQGLEDEAARFQFLDSMRRRPAEPPGGDGDG